MKFTITNAGIAAADIAASGGPYINITQYKVGSGVAYSPSAADTALHGTLLYTGTPRNYSVITADTVQYDLLMDETVGNFSYGEVGLYLADGTLFALSARETVQQKIATPTPGYNAIQIEARLRLTNISSLIEYTVLALTNAKILEVASIDNLEPPLLADSNAYICHSGDDYGNPILAIRNSDYRWGFHTHLKQVASGAVITSYQITNAAIVNAGTGYSVNDVLTISGGTFITACQLKVLTVGGSGEITSVSITEPGVYTVVPGNPVSVSSGVATFTLTTATANTSIQLVTSASLSEITNMQAGKYLLQFTSAAGNLRGVCRNVSANTSGTIKWSTPLIQVPIVGDTFEVFRSNASILDEALAVISGLAADNSLINAIIFGE
jgi:hypothetical protein